MWNTTPSPLFLLFQWKYLRHRTSTPSPLFLLFHLVRIHCTSTYTILTRSIVNNLIGWSTLLIALIGYIPLTTSMQPTSLPYSLRPPRHITSFFPWTRNPHSSKENPPRMSQRFSKTSNLRTPSHQTSMKTTGVKAGDITSSRQVVSARLLY